MSVVSVGEHAIVEGYSFWFTITDKICGDVFLYNPPVKIIFPADRLNFKVNELLAAFMLANAGVDRFLACHADIKAICGSAPNDVNGELNI